MTRKKRATLEPWQASNARGQFVPLSYELVASDAFKALTKKQTSLYLFACQRRYATIKHNSGKLIDGDISPAGRWPTVPGVTGDCFYLNIAIATACGVYASDDRKTFYRDRKRLAVLGFIDVVIDGTRYRPKGKTVFKMSERWKAYHKDNKPP